jgi:hypothetical protein
MRGRPRRSQFGVQEADVEGGVVDDELGAGEELEQLVGDLAANSGLSARKSSVRPCTARVGVARRSGLR